MELISALNHANFVMGIKWDKKYFEIKDGKSNIFEGLLYTIPCTSWFMYMISFYRPKTEPTYIMFNGETNWKKTLS